MTATTLLSEVPAYDEDLPDIASHKYLWTLDAVYRAMKAGVFGGEPCDRLKMELIEGELLEIMTPNPPHWTAVFLIQELLKSVFGAGYGAVTQSPLYVDEHSVPEPDVMVLAGAIRDYDRLPTGADARLVIEVSDTTVYRDRKIKPALYARAGITDYWVLILKDRTLEIRRDPVALASGKFKYRTLLTFQETDTVSPLHAPDALIKVSDLLPKPAAE